MAHARLGRQMQHPGRPLGGEQGRHRLGVHQVEAMEAESPRWGQTLKPLQPGPLQGRVVVSVEVVEADHPLASGQELLGHSPTDEAGDPGDEDRCPRGQRPSRRRSRK